MHKKPLIAQSVCLLSVVRNWNQKRADRYRSCGRSVFRLLALYAGALFLAGCVVMPLSELTPTPTSPAVAAIPTFTPTPEGEAAVQVETSAGATAEQPAPAATQEVQVAPTAVQPAAPATPTETSTPLPSVARFTVKTDLTATNVNVRAGPSTAFRVIGTVPRGAQFNIIGRNVENTWFKFCCVSGQEGWIFAALLNVQNAQLIAMAQNIPATPAPPTPVPATAVPPTAVPPPAQADPCAGIGGDGCKFKLRNTDFRPQRSELKLYFGFVHGNRNDEIQGVGGSYYVELHKDGVHVSAVDSSTRGGNATHNGPQGNKYNYHKRVPLNQVPGGNVDGRYTIWVKDGNGERDSQNFNFTVSGGNGEVWLIFDQK